jgi:predicted Zn-dependent protease
MGMPDRAASIRGQAMASGAYRDPKDPWIDLLLDDCYDPFRLALDAGALADAGDPAAAIRRLKRAIVLSPDNHALHFQLAGVYLATRSYDQAREHLVRCTQLAPKFPDGWAHLSHLYATVGDRAAAEETLAEGLAHCPQSPGLHLAHARRLRQTGRIEESIAEFRKSIELRPNEAGARVELARLLVAEDRVNDARIELQAALAAEPEHPDALSILAYDAIADGDETVARQWLHRVANQPRVDAEQRSTLMEAFRRKFGRRFE